MMVTLYSIQGHAQEDVIYYPRLREQIQPSPISRIYPQYLMHKPDLSTGAMDISILLYTAETPGFSIPFELNKVHGRYVPITSLTNIYGNWIPGTMIRMLVMMFFQYIFPTGTIRFCWKRMEHPGRYWQLIHR